MSLKIVLISFIALIATNCSKDDGNPPVLPPAESMTIDFSNFTAQNKSAAIAPVAAEINNWGFSALVAGYFRALIVGSLVVPVYSFKMAASEVPALISDKTWQWNYSTTLQSTTYQCRLTGQIREL